MSGIPGGSGFGRYDGNTFHYDRPASDEGSRALDQQFEDPHSGLPHHGPGQPPPTSSASTSGNSGFPPSSGSSGWAPPMPPYGAPQGRGAGGTGRGYGNQYEVTGLTQTTLRDAQSGEIHYLQRDVRYQDRSAFPTETYSAGPGFFPAQPHSAGGHGLYDDYAPAGPSSSYGPVSASRAAYAQEPQIPFDGRHLSSTSSLHYPASSQFQGGIAPEYAPVTSLQTAQPSAQLTAAANAIHASRMEDRHRNQAARSFASTAAPASVSGTTAQDVVTIAQRFRQLTPPSGEVTLNDLPELGSVRRSKRPASHTPPAARAPNRPKPGPDDSEAITDLEADQISHAMAASRATRAPRVYNPFSTPGAGSSSGGGVSAPGNFAMSSYAPGGPQLPAASSSAPHASFRDRGSAPDHVRDFVKAHPDSSGTKVAKELKLRYDITTSPSVIDKWRMSNFDRPSVPTDEERIDIRRRLLNGEHLREVQDALPHLDRDSVASVRAKVGAEFYWASLAEHQRSGLGTRAKTKAIRETRDKFGVADETVREWFKKHPG